MAEGGGDESPATHGVCAFCLLNNGKYTCPRCNLRYCSSDCYKNEKHLQCSEDFYKDCFMDGLKDYHASDDDKKKMVEMLSRLENAEDLEGIHSDDDDIPDLAERMEGIDLDGDPDKIWERLSDKEREEFMKMVEDGRLANVIEEWEPWWNKKDSLVKEIGINKTEKKKKDLAKEEKERSINIVSMAANGTLGLTNNVKISAEQKITQQETIVKTQQKHFKMEMPDKQLMDLCPKIVKNILDISKISKSKPSDSVRHNLVNILYSYAYCVRKHNGDHWNTVTQFCQEILLLSDVLGGSINYSNSKEAVHGCFQCLQQKAKDLFDSEGFSVSIMEDVQKIILGPSKHCSLFFTLAALSDLQQLFHRAVKVLSEELKKTSGDSDILDKLKSDKQTYFHVEKKLDFLLSWTQSYGRLLQSSVPEIAFELGTLMLEVTEQQTTEEALKKSGITKKKKKLIEEI